MAWEHEDDCLYGFKVFQLAWDEDKYFIKVFYRCRWYCPGQAIYRILKVGEKALGCEEELSYEYHSQPYIKNKLKPRASRRNKGWMSFSLHNTQDKLVVAHPSILQSPVSHPAPHIILEAAHIAIDTGVIRLTKARLWAPDDTTGHIPLDLPPIPDKTQLDKSLEAVGLRHGRIHPPRPIKVLEEQLRVELKKYEGINPYLI